MRHGAERSGSSVAKATTTSRGGVRSFGGGHGSEEIDEGDKWSVKELSKLPTLLFLVYVFCLIYSNA